MKFGKRLKCKLGTIQQLRKGRGVGRGIKRSETNRYEIFWREGEIRSRSLRNGKKIKLLPLSNKNVKFLDRSGLFLQDSVKIFS